MKLKISFSNGACPIFCSTQAFTLGYNDVNTIADDNQNVIAMVFEHSENNTSNDFTNLINLLQETYPTELTFEVIE